MDQDLKELLSGVELETKCEHCSGRGGEEELGKWFDCSWCDGAGYIPAEAGKAILRLVQHNFAKMQQHAAEKSAYRN